MPERRHVTRVFDTHHHVGELALGIEEVTGEAAVTRKADEHRAMLDDFGITAVAVIPGFQYERTRGIDDTRRINTDIASYRDADRTRFPVALGILEPLYDLKANEEELERLVSELQIDGIAWHTRYQAVAVSDRRMHQLVERVADRGLPCYVHMFYESGLESPWMLIDLARAHPEATIVALDAFSGATNVRWMDDIAERCPNVLFDTAIAFPLLRPIDSFVEKFGSERLLFGTDSYAKPLLYNYPSSLNELLYSPMPQQDLEAILGGNFLRLFPQAVERIEAASTERGDADAVTR
ncbi:amidohydrolase family protein [Lysinimonas soli]|uniref:Amidohydrolase family protein n=1 Tax=Lysinimonas soli TaxID=1074233 RepID=A0ABW0NR11_9MICO